MGNEDEHDDQPQEPGGQGGNGNGNGQGNGNGNGRKGEPLEVELSRQPSYLADMHALRRNRSLRMLVGGDLHNHQRAMRWFYKLAEQQQPDLIVFLGDFVNGEPLEYIREICASLRTLVVSPRSPAAPSPATITPPAGSGWPVCASLMPS